MTLCTIFAIVLVTFYLIIIILDKTCHAVPMMLVANSCLAEIVFGSEMFGVTLITLQNDLKQIQYQDSLCVFRGYMGHIVAVLQNYSYLLQAMFNNL